MTRGPRNWYVINLALKSTRIRQTSFADEYESIARSIGFKSKDEKTANAKKSKIFDSDVPKISLSKSSKSPQKSSSSSASDSSDEEKRPESPGIWEIVPGSSKTRPQFIKIRPGETLESSIEARNAAFSPTNSVPTKKTQRQGANLKMGLSLLMCSSLVLRILSCLCIRTSCISKKWPKFAETYCM